MRKRFITAFIFITAFVLVPSFSQAVHKGAGGLTCGQCHTMHNSQGGTKLEGAVGGSMLLLRADITSRAEIHKLCLQCHASNGSMGNTSHEPQNVKAPKVYSSSSWDLWNPLNKIGAGGNFSSELDSSWALTTTNLLGNGHSIGATNVMPPGGDTAIAEFSCTNCHDPHGTDNPANTSINIYRNLKVNATGAGANSGVKFVNDASKPYREYKSYVGGVNGAYFGGSETDNSGKVIWPVYRGNLTGNAFTDSANSNAYGTGKDEDLKATGNGTMSLWCAQCHDSWHEAIETNNQYRLAGGGGDSRLYSRRHATNSAISRGLADGSCTCHSRGNSTREWVSRKYYNSSIITGGRGLPVTANANLPFNVYYLPLEAENWGGHSTGLEDKHKVFCLTCHFAHGGPYKDNLRWDYLDTVSAGGQSPKGISTKVGCRMCHYILR